MPVGENPIGIFLFNNISAVLSHKLTVDAEIDIHPGIVDEHSQVARHVIVSIYELHQVGIILRTGIPAELLHHHVEGLAILVIPAYALGGSLHAVAQSDDVYQDALRRLRVVEILRIAALAIIPLMMTKVVSRNFS